LSNSVHSFCLRRQFLGGGSAFLGARRVGLSHLIHLLDSFRDLLDSTRLLLASLVHLLDEDLHLSRTFCDGMNRNRRFFELRAARVRLRDGFLD
jgi:hypothetical protein